MGKITDFLRKIGLLRITKGDYTTGEYHDTRADVKKDPSAGSGQDETPTPEAPVEPTMPEAPKEEMPAETETPEAEDSKEE